MGLPKLDTPTYRLTLPSTREEIQYRPFLVKEQKLLLMAQESEDDQQIIDTVSSLVRTCTFEKIDADSSPMFDIEYIFLNIRAKSVGEKVQLRLICPDDEKTSVDVEVDINDVSVQMTADHTNEVKITDTVKLFLKYPILKDMKGLSSDASEMEKVFSLLNQCVQEIHYEEQIFNRVDFSEKDIDEFMDQLTADQFKLITDFFDTMPKLRHVIPVKNPKTEVESEVVVEGLASFLG
tara:strand:- start:2553 stop:3260 length:708 start_codon:yes stop_codon:yes gene_type:complete